MKLVNYSVYLHLFYLRFVKEKKTETYEENMYVLQGKHNYATRNPDH